MQRDFNKIVSKLQNKMISYKIEILYTYLNMQYIRNKYKHFIETSFLDNNIKDKKM